MQHVEIVKIEDFGIGFERLKRSKLELSGDKSLYEYSGATFSLENLSYGQVNPSTFYALENHLEFQRNLLKMFKEQCSVDLFDLQGITYFKIDNVLHSIVPPIIEIYEEVDGKDNYALQDGIHRFLLTKELGIKQKCMVIHNKKADKNYLPYAYTNSWDEVKMYKEVPEVKKRYRRDPHYSFMRPLRNIFDTQLINNWAEYGR